FSADVKFAAQAGAAPARGIPLLGREIDFPAAGTEGTKCMTTAAAQTRHGTTTKGSARSRRRSSMSASSSHPSIPERDMPLDAGALVEACPAQALSLCEAVTPSQASNSAASDGPGPVTPPAPRLVPTQPDQPRDGKAAFRGGLWRDIPSRRDLQ